MRHHFYRCGHLRVLALAASELGGKRKGGGPILEELCDARDLTPCVGLLECTVLASQQKRHLLTQRATLSRVDVEAVSAFFAGTGLDRQRELEELREQLLEERERIVDENRRFASELGAALDTRAVVGPSEEAELAEQGMSVQLDDELRAFRSSRLDAIDDALDAMRRGVYGDCAACGRPIDVARLRVAPEARACHSCARAAEPVSLEGECSASEVHGSSRAHYTGSSSVRAMVTRHGSS